MLMRSLKTFPPLNERDVELEAQETVTIRNEIAEIPKVVEQFTRFAGDHELPKDFVNAVSPVFDELLTNTIFYGYMDEEEHSIEIRFGYDNGRMTLVFSDDGKSFNPLTKAAPDRRSPVEERKVGGLGINLVRKLMDSVQYKRVQNKNVLTVMKKFVTVDPYEGPHDAIPN